MGSCTTLVQLMSLQVLKHLILPWLSAVHAAVQIAACELTEQGTHCSAAARDSEPLSGRIVSDAVQITLSDCLKGAACCAALYSRA
jgi:hypothetical protein